MKKAKTELSEHIEHIIALFRYALVYHQVEYAPHVAMEPVGGISNTLRIPKGDIMYRLWMALDVKSKEQGNLIALDEVVREVNALRDTLNVGLSWDNEDLVLTELGAEDTYFTSREPVVMDMRLLSFALNRLNLDLFEITTLTTTAWEYFGIEGDFQ